MKTGKIIDQNNTGNNKQVGKGNFNIEFDTKVFGPYNWLYDRNRLYFDENTGNRGSYFFPLKNKNYNNTELFLETDDIVVALGERGSFSGEEKQFLEIINIETHNKYRFYPDEVSLIYNSQDSIVVYYKKSQKNYKLTLSRETCEKVSENSLQLSAFFKLYYNHENKNFGRLIFNSRNNNPKDGYFIEEEISESDFGVPVGFSQEVFRLKMLNNSSITMYLDVWEASLTGKINPTTSH